MEERFDKLEQMIGSLATRFDAVDQRFDAVDRRFDEVDRKFDAVDQRFNEVDRKLDAVDQRFNEVDESLKGVRQGLADVNQRVGVLHEDVKSDFRLTLEAQQGLREAMEAGFADQERSFREALAPIGTQSVVASESS